MLTINKLESEIAKLVNIDFLITTNSCFKEKNISVYMDGKAFKSTSTRWEGAVNSVFAQIKGYYKG